MPRAASRSNAVKRTPPVRRKKRNDVIDDAAETGLGIQDMVYSGLAIPGELSRKALDVALKGKDAVKKALHLNSPAKKNVTDRAHRYRANNAIDKPAKRCVYCGTNGARLEVAHLDGHEENNDPKNLDWTCRSCNVLVANRMRKLGLGRKTHQYNPKAKGATSTAQWITAVLSMRGESNAMSTADAVDMIRATSKEKRSQFARDIWDTRRERGTDATSRWNPRKKNSAAAADHFYQKFHGKPASERITVKERIHEHEHLGNIGTLKEMLIDLENGRGTARITFADPVPWLASAEDGRSLYIVGGDQKLNLKDLGMNGDWEKDRMVIGQFSPPRCPKCSEELPKKGSDFQWRSCRNCGHPLKDEVIGNITYTTSKDFDDFETIDYCHDLGEPRDDETERRAAPYLEYEPRNELMYITGGEYKIKLPFFGTSPGIEN